MKKAVERIVEYAVHAARPEKIILFGSFASGKDGVNSDVDLLVVCERGYMKRELEEKISSMAREFALKADILIHTPDEVERARLKLHSFLGSIVKEGRVVYEKPRKG